MKYQHEPISEEPTPSEGAREGQPLENSIEEPDTSKSMDPERFQSVFTATAHVTIEPDPETYRQATSGPRTKEWNKAILEEYASLCAREVFDLQHPPKGKKTIPVKWILKTRFDKDGCVSRYKARLVVKGFHQ